jgi:hypothetical protein
VQFLEYAEAEEMKPEDRPEPVREVTLADARRLFLAAHEEDVDKALGLKNKPAAGLRSLVAYEAGKTYLELAVREDMPEADADEVAMVKRNIAKIEALPMGPITPIVFSLEPHKDIDDLLAQDATAVFDLDGNGSAERWPWVRPTTAFLAWDPAGTGEIASGRQLFGTGTWWMLFEDGYAALDALDDTRDGTLAGGELDGLAAWFDRNGNGVSDAGEVVALEKLGVQSIAVRPDGETDGMLMHSAGLTLEDGRTVPTYDWVTEPSDGAAHLPQGLRSP